MQSRAARYTLLGLLLAVGIAAAAFVGWTRQRVDAVHTAATTVTLHIDRLIEAVGEAGAAHAAYVAPGQPLGPSLDRFETLLQQIASETDALRPLTRAAESAAALQTLANAADRLAEADARARESLRLEDPFAAADAIFNDAHETRVMMQSTLHDLRAAEASAAASERASVEQPLLLAIGGTALLWLAGLIALARVPREPVEHSTSIVDYTPTVITSDAIPTAAVSSDATAGRAAERVAAMAAAPLAVDLSAAADLCTDMSRVTNAAALPDLLARAAAVLDATGIIVWVSAGDDLFAVTAHGYDPRIISRLGPIERSADNATATAWRTGEVRTVPGDTMSNGAIVAPMFGPESCIGVLAAEVRHGRENDAATRAVTAMLAAQLATAVGVWPAAQPSEA